MAATANRVRNRVPADFYVETRRKEEQARQELLDRINYYNKTAAQSNFERHTTENIERNHILRRFEALKVSEQSQLEERRQKLRDLFDQDEERYRQQLSVMEETSEQRVQKMRERVAELRQKREEERQKIVEEKLLQRFRNECDELRERESKALVQELSAVRSAQMAEREQQKLHDLEERRHYDALWEADRLRKIAREEADREAARLRNEKTVNELNQQMEMLRQKALEEERLKAEEARLMREEIEMRAQEDQRAKMRKVQEQRAVRADLDGFNRERLAQKARELREGIEMDMRIVTEFLNAEEREKTEKSRRKEQLKREMAAYREHLIELQQLQKEREREVEQMYRSEEEKLWRARAERWQREQAARDRLMQEVMATRAEQIRYSRELNQQKLAEVHRDKEQLEKLIETIKREQIERRAKEVEKQDEYKRTLTSQIEHVRERRREEAERVRAEAQAEKDAYEALEKRIQWELAHVNDLPRVKAFRAANRSALVPRDGPSQK